MFWIDEKMIIKKIVLKTIGLIQVSIGGLSACFGYILFDDFFDLQTILGLSSGEIGFYLWILTTFGILSTISGLLLLYEK